MQIQENLEEVGADMSKCGRKTEVYSRVCGYFRPVANWNRGKKEEFRERKVFEVPGKEDLKKKFKEISRKVEG